MDCHKMRRARRLWLNLTRRRHMRRHTKGGGPTRRKEMMS